MNTLSLIIPTYNRSESLGRTLDSMAKCVAPAGWQVEVMVVDNNSADATPQAVYARQGGTWFDLRYALETAQGSNMARNRGLRETTGEVLLFVDDDLTFHPDWAVDICTALERFPDVPCMGARVLPVFEAGTPTWVDGEFEEYFGKQDLGDQVCDIQWPRFPVEMNLAIRRSVFERIGGFAEYGCRDSTSLRTNDGKFFFRRFREHGLRTLYIPSAPAYHMIPASRSTVAWITRRVYWQGRSDVEYDAHFETPGRLSLWRKWFSAYDLWRAFTSASFNPIRVYWFWKYGRLASKRHAFFLRGVVTQLFIELFRPRSTPLADKGLPSARTL